MNRCLQTFVCLGVLLLAFQAPTRTFGSTPTPKPSPTPTCVAYSPGHDINSVPPAQLYTGPAPPMPSWLANSANTTPPPAPIPSPNPSQANADTAAGNSALKAGNYNSQTGCPNGGPENNVSGTLLEQIYNTANGFRGTDTCWQFTNCGEEACAAAVQRIVLITTGATIGSFSVDDWRILANNGSYGGQIVPAQSSHRGAIIIWPQSQNPVLGHMGICATDGCTQTWSNSSSKHTFAPQTWGLYFDGTYTSYVIWEPAHIP